MRQPAAQWQWTPADEKQLRQLREQGVSIDKIAKMIHRSHSAVTRKCRAMGLTNQTLHRVAPSPKTTPSDEPRTDAIDRAGKTTLPPLPSLRDELPVVQAGLSDRAEKRGSRGDNARAPALSDPFSGGAIC
jgi:hypothetical protein